MNLALWILQIINGLVLLCVVLALTKFVRYFIYLIEEMRGRHK